MQERVVLVVALWVAAFTVPLTVWTHPWVLAILVGLLLVYGFRRRDLSMLRLATSTLAVSVAGMLTAYAAALLFFSRLARLSAGSLIGSLWSENRSLFVFLLLAWPCIYVGMAVLGRAIESLLHRRSDDQEEQLEASSAPT